MLGTARVNLVLKRDTSHRDPTPPVFLNTTLYLGVLSCVFHVLFTNVAGYVHNTSAIHSEYCIVDPHPRNTYRLFPRHAQYIADTLSICVLRRISAQIFTSAPVCAFSRLCLLAPPLLPPPGLQEPQTSSLTWVILHEEIVALGDEPCSRLARRNTSQALVAKLRQAGL